MNMKPGYSRHIIVIQRPALWAVSLLVLLCIGLVSVWMVYEYGRYAAGYDSADAQQQIAQLKMQVDKLETKSVETQRRSSMLERNRQIDDDASEQLKGSLIKAQNEVLGLKKELAFYKSIVAPEQGGRSLAIQAFQLKPDNNGGYLYKIMITQRGRNDRFARGVIHVSIEGVTKGKPVTLKLSEVSNEHKKVMKFGFKYFQSFEGVMTLPDAFQPDLVRIRVNAKTGRIKPIDKKFSWSDLTAGGA